VSGILDTVGMLDLAAALPEQVAEAAALAADVGGLPRHEDIENVVVLGMGGSGIGGDIMAAVAGPFMSVPIGVVKGYETPSYVGPNTLCFAISYSGDTEETVEATQAAVEAGASMVILSRGGELAALADALDFPHLVLPDIPMPRAGVGAVSIPGLLLLEKVGLFPGARQYVADAIEQLHRRRDKLIMEGSSAQQLAREIGRTMVVAYGGESIGEVAAYRFKCQVNENAKAPAFAGTLPEMCHNEICGWGQDGDVTRQVMTVVRFRHDFEHPQVTRRFDLTYDLLDEVVHAVCDVEAQGEGPLAQLFDLIIQGDFTSLRLAIDNQVDPGPIPVLEALKVSLAR
jgi:glucose/mannose-6-phosphate isomerase